MDTLRVHMHCCIALSQRASPPLTAAPLPYCPTPYPTTGLAMIAAAGMIVQETFVTHAKLF